MGRSSFWISHRIIIMTLQETNLTHFMNQVQFVPQLTTKLINEDSSGGLTYYELRQFLAVLLQQSSSSDTKKLLDDLLKTVSKLEIMHVATPNIRRQKSVSPKIF